MQGEIIRVIDFKNRRDRARAVADSIRKARKARKLRQADLAKILHVHQSAISQWESGEAEPSVENRLRLAAALDISWREMLPEASVIPDEALEDPQARLLIESYLQLRPRQRDMLLLFAQRMLEDNDAEGR